MSINNLNIKNLYTLPIDEKIFMCGEIKTTASTSDSLTVDSMFPDDVHVVIPSQLDLKHSVSTYPISKNNIYLYDQQGNVTNKWLSDRINNNPGDVKNNTSQVVLFNQIDIPKVPENTNLVLVLNKHASMTECSSGFIKEQIIKSDLEKFYGKLNPKVKNYLILTKEVDKDVFSSDIPANLNITKIVLDSGRLIPGLAELLFGKIIKSGPTSYQTFLNVFQNTNQDENTECVKFEGISIWNNNSSKMSMNLRSNGRIHITCYDTDTSCKFMAIFDGKSYSKDSESTSLSWEKDCLVKNFKSNDLVYSDGSLINLLNLHQFLSIVSLSNEMLGDTISIGSNDVGIQALFSWYSEMDKMDCEENSFDELFKKFYTGTISNIIDKIVNYHFKISKGPIPMLGRVSSLNSGIMGAPRFRSMPFSGIM